MSAFMSSNPEHDDGIPWEQSIEWIFDTALKLPADHPARTPGLINCALLDSEQAPTKVELWCEDNPHHEQPAAYLWTQAPHHGELVEDTNERIEVNGNLYAGSEIHMRSSKYPEILFDVTLHADIDNDPPWQNSDGHGPVRAINDLGRELKRPGERVLWGEHNTTWLYDWQAACKMAREQGWNAEPYDAPKRVERAVNADYDYLRSYLRGDWGYVVVKVEALKDEESLGDDVLGGVETNDDAYLQKTISECADSIADLEDLPARIKRMHAERIEAAERAYWAARDVVTSS
jgi:hypothetical protein